MFLKLFSYKKIEYTFVHFISDRSLLSVNLIKADNRRPELTVPIYILCLNNQVSGHSTGMKADANVKTAFEIVHVALIKSTVGKP